MPQSDFFALGRTVVHLLTGQHPNKLNLQHWHQKTRQPISPGLAKLIDDLMAVSPKDRPKTAQVILQRIQRKFPWRRVAGTVTVSAIAAALIAYTHHIRTHLPVCDSHIGDHLSCGEEILLPDFSPALSDKQRGVEAFTTGNYPKAKLWFTQAWTKERDPETLIYLNNARVSTLQTAQSPVYTIAAIVPISTPSRSSVGQQILWGVAQAQDQAIQQGVNLRVVLADDGNDPTQAQHIANALVQRSGVLSVVGHYASEVTVAVLPTYQDHQLVLVSPTSVADSLSAQSQRPDHVFFRTTWTTRLAAKMLIDHLIKQSPPSPLKVAVFYNPDSEFSLSMQQQFAQQLAVAGGQIVADPNLSLADFDAKSAIARAHQQGATALAVFPDGHTYRYTFPNALSLIEENRGQDWVLGASTLYDTETLGQVGKAALNRFVVSAFWHPLSSPNPKFSRAARQYWKGDVGIRTATSYDAVQVLVEALNQQAHPSRVGIQQVLANPNFKAKGATGTIQFNGSDRREELNTLIKVVPKCSHSGYTFVPVDYAKACY
ncbi:MAG: ABC transporter substrate-binding protein [Leptolyngbyaceae cyanobacterium RU_5_1]|nr:ABC transporter substrate-binding protein [Leptolyngbyaceae cyanobacterium RU_5_1]